MLIGVQLFAGSTALCNDSTVTTKNQCVGMFVNFEGVLVARQWQNRAWGSFDNVGMAFFSMMPVIGVSGWVQIM